MRRRSRQSKRTCLHTDTYLLSGREVIRVEFSLSLDAGPESYALAQLGGSLLKFPGEPVQNPWQSRLGRTLCELTDLDPREYAPWRLSSLRLEPYLFLTQSDLAADLLRRCADLTSAQELPDRQKASVYLFNLIESLDPHYSLTLHQDGEAFKQLEFTLET
jgi:hypothetical protein